MLLAEPIRKLGSYTVSVKLHPEVASDITVQVNPRESTTEEESKDIETARSSIENAPGSDDDSDDRDDDEATDSE